MNIFFIRKSEILTKISEESFANKYKSKKQDAEYILGRFLVKFADKKFFGEKNLEIKLEDKKPKLNNPNLNFSISHSNNIVAVCFDKNAVGFDIEFMGKNRDIEALAKHLRINAATEKEFYQYWTGYEAEYKCKKQNLNSFIFEKNYMCSVSSFDGDIKSKLKIY